MISVAYYVYALHTNCIAQMAGSSQLLTHFPKYVVVILAP